MEQIKDVSRANKSHFILFLKWCQSQTLSISSCDPFYLIMWYTRVYMLYYYKQNKVYNFCYSDILESLDYNLRVVLNISNPLPNFLWNDAVWHLLGFYFWTHMCMYGFISHYHEISKYTPYTSAFENRFEDS